MNILVIAPQLPAPPNNGGITRLYNLYSRLAKRHHITWICPIWSENAIYVQEAKRICDQVHPLPDWQPDFPSQGLQRFIFRFVARLRWERLFLFNYGYVNAPGLYWLPVSSKRLNLIERVLSSSNYDLLICEFEGTAELIPPRHNIPKVLMLHNFQSSLFQRIRQANNLSKEDRLFFWPELLKIIQYERKNYSRFDLATTVSETDRRILKKRCPKLSVEIIPNGVDPAFYQPVPTSGSSGSLMYFGHYGYPPNADAILYFCREILPLIRQRKPNVQVMVVGYQPPQELRNYEGINIIGAVPDVRPYLAQASIVVVPLRLGGGTRLKILEALAMEKAIVSTTIGAEGLKVINGENILLADRPNEFANCVIRLLEQPGLRALLGRNGRRLVSQDYDWDILAARLENNLESIVKQYSMNHGLP